MKGLMFCDGCFAVDDEPCRPGCLAIAALLDNPTLTYAETAEVMRRYNIGLDDADAARLHSMSGYDPFDEGTPRRMVYNTGRLMYHVMHSIIGGQA